MPENRRIWIEKVFYSDFRTLPQAIASSMYTPVRLSTGSGQVLFASKGIGMGAIMAKSICFQIKIAFIIGFLVN
jgi:NOL1/NOP2/fmu family ribosome biogenesis protein